MKKRWLSLALAAVFCLSLLPVTAGAASAQTIRLELGGVNVKALTADQQADIFGDGTASYAEDSYGLGTLTLNNCTINGDGSSGAALYFGGGLTINLIGQNALLSGSKMFGISYDNEGSLSFTGGGSLVVSCDGNGNSQTDAIFVKSLYLGTNTNPFTGTLIATGGNAGENGSSGIHVQDILYTMNSTGTVIATGGPGANSYGILIDNNQTSTISGGVVIAQGGNATSASYGIRANAAGNVNISDSAAVVMRAGLVNGEINPTSGTRAACNVEPTATTMKSFTNGAGAVYVPNGWTYGTPANGITLSETTLANHSCYVSTGPSPVTTAASSINTNGKTLLCVDLYEGTADDIYGLNLTDNNNVTVTGGGKVIAVSGITTYLYSFTNGLAPMGDSYGLYCAKLTVEDTEIVGVGGPSNYESVGVYPRGGAEISGAGKITGVGGPSFGVSNISSGGPSIGICTYGENPTSLSGQAQILGVGGYSISENSTGFSGGTCTVPVGTSMLCVGGIAERDSHGAVAVGGGTVSGAFAALGGKAGQRSVGARIDQLFTVNDGARVSVLAGDSSSSYGFRGYSDYADVIVNGGDFRAAGRTAAFNNIAGYPSVEVGSGVTLMSYSDYAGTAGAAPVASGTAMDSFTGRLCVKTAPIEYPLWICGTRVTGANASDVLGDGKVSYDAQTNTLTLNNASITGGSENTNNYGWGICYRGTDDFKIVANGTNTVADNSYRTYASYGIVIGEPSPLVHSTAAVNVTITVSDGASLTVSGGNINQSEDYSGSWGILNKGAGALIINGSGDLIAEAKDNSRKSIGIVAQDVTIDSSCSVTAAGGDSTGGFSAGIYCGNFTVPQSFTGSVTATAGNALGMSYNTGTYGIRTTGDCAIGGGSVTASTGNMTGSGTSGDYGVGIFGENSLSISGGAIVNATGDGCGLWCYQGTVSIDASTVTATGNNKAANGLNLTNVTAVGSASVDGTDPTEYDNSVYTTYKYVKTTPVTPDPPAPTPTPSGGGTATYPVTPPAEVDNATVTVSPKNAAAGQTVTVTITPDEGYKTDSVTVTDKNGKEIEVTDNGDGTYSFKMPASKVTVTPVIIEDEPVPLANRPFVDVPEGSWFYDAAYHCYDNGYFQGVDDTHFDPQGTMTRAMFATVLYRIAGEPAVTGENPFADVEADSWYTDAVVWAAGEGIIGGYGDGLFGTNDPVTREQMVTIFWRYNGQPSAESGDLSGFADADQISPWARDAFTWAVEAGIISGKGDGVLDPKGTATRAEVAQIVMNYDTMDEG